MKLIYKDKKTKEVDPEIVKSVEGKHNPYEDNSFFFERDFLAYGEFLICVQNSTKKGCCIPEAYRLKRESGNRGDIYFLDDLNHAYYVEDPKNLEAIARNQKDNEFEGFPALTVKEVLKRGKLLPPTIEEHYGVIRIESTLCDKF